MHNTGAWYLNPKCIRLFECECKCLFKDEMQDAFRKIDSAFGTGQASVFILCEGFFIPFTHLSNHHWWTNRLLVCNLICRVIANQNALSLSLSVCGKSGYQFPISYTSTFVDLFYPIMNLRWFLMKCMRYIMEYICTELPSK